MRMLAAQLIHREMGVNCTVCGSPFIRTSSKSKRVTCSRRCAVTLSWRNPETKAQRKASISKNKQQPEVQEKLAEFNRQRWAREGEREKLAQRTREMWADPEKHEQLTMAIAAVNRAPEKRAFYSELRREAWSDPVYREKTVAGIRASKSTPEARALFSRLLKARWDDPIWRAWMLVRSCHIGVMPNLDDEQKALLNEPLPFVGRPVEICVAKEYEIGQWPLWELGVGQCHWPFGDGPYLFCGARRNGHLVYCSAHAAKAAARQGSG